MIAVLVCFLLMLVLQLATPFWWWIMIVPFFYGASKARSMRESVKIGMISAAALWLVMSGYQWLAGSGDVSQRVIAMVGWESSGILVIITTLVAALASGSAACSGYCLRKVFLASDSLRKKSELA